MSTGVIHTNHFSTHQISSRNYVIGLCHFYTSYAITRRPYAPTSSLLGLGHRTGPSAPQHRPCRSVDFKHIQPTPLLNPLHCINYIDLARHETDKSLLQLNFTLHSCASLPLSSITRKLLLIFTRVRLDELQIIHSTLYFSYFNMSVVEACSTLGGYATLGGCISFGMTLS